MSGLQLVQERAKYLWNTQKLLVLSVIFAFVLLIIAVIIAFATTRSSRLNTTPSAPIQTANPNPANTPQKNTVPAPSVFFDSYTNKSSTPSAYINLSQAKNKNINVYSFKSNFSDSEVKEFATSLGVSVDTLNFNKISGSFHYQSQVEQEVKNTALNFLSRLKIGNTTLSDPSLTCNITYKRQDLPGVTFTECHRNWEEIGLPIYNYVGILNLPQDIQLSSLTLGSVMDDFPSNPNITKILIDGKRDIKAEGKIRPTDFNSITVGIDNKGSVVSVESNLRWIESTKQYSASADLLTPEQALTQFMNHKSDLSLTIPAGSGIIDWNKVYQNNQAHGKEAVITEHLLSYLENPPSVKQSFLTPMYTIRGYAILDTGFRVNFIQTVPALEDSVLGTSTQLAEADNSHSSIQIGVYNPPSPSPTPSPQQSQQAGAQSTNPSLPVDPPQNNPPAAGEATVPQIRRPLPGVQPSNPRWYYMSCRNQASVDASNLPRGVTTISGGGPGETLLLVRSQEDLDNATHLLPECLVTAVSPSLFLYSMNNTKVLISVYPYKTYTVPSMAANILSAVIYPNNTFIPTNSNIPYDYLYYEYDSSKVSFNKSNSGFSVKYSDWQQTVGNIADKFGLNQKEKDRLVLEVKNELYGKPVSDYLNISIIDPDELNTKLPLSISPTPDNTHRIHLLLAPSDTIQTLPKPEIKTINRSDFYAVEVGARYEK